jgi:hypothetical protein
MVEPDHLAWRWRQGLERSGVVGIAADWMSDANDETGAGGLVDAELPTSFDVIAIAPVS